MLSATLLRRNFAREMSSISSKLPLVAVIGTTGSGKSRVAIDIALACNGEVVNADAMQVYKGLDTITNKATKGEMRGVPHHLMGYKDPGEETFVTEWVGMASDCIASIHSKNRLPIVVGGTSYWLQSLLFTNRLVATVDTSKAPKVGIQPGVSLQTVLNQLSPADHGLFSNLPDDPPTATSNISGTRGLWELLNKLDSQMASRWHWKDSRKVLRSLEIIKETGRRASDVLKEQDQENQDSRYRTLVIWTYTEKDVLNPRLDKRVDQMIRDGLLDEINELRGLEDNISLENRRPIDYTRGIFQAIGYKEFHEHLNSPSETSFDTAVRAMKHATQKYAAYQTKWIRRKFLPVAQAMPDTHIYVLDTTDVDGWSRIEDSAARVSRAFVSNGELPLPSDIAPNADSLLAAAVPLSRPSDALSANRKVTCDLCSRDPAEPFVVNADDWTIHLNSRGHRARIKSKKKREHNLEYLRKRAEGELGRGTKQVEIQNPEMASSRKGS